MSDAVSPVRAYTLLSNVSATGASGAFAAGSAGGLSIIVKSATTSSATVVIQQSTDKVDWVTVATVSNPAAAGSIVLVPPMPYTRANVTAYASGIITAKVSTLQAPVTWAGALGGNAVTFGALSVASLTDTGLTATRVPFASTGGLLADDAALTFTVGTGAFGATKFIGAFDGSTVKASSLTATRVPFAGAAGLLSDDATLTFDSTAKALGATVLKGGKQSTCTAKATDGAIASAPGTIVITKGSALGSSTLATPTVTAHDGYVLRIVSTTAYAHVITVASGKVNGGANTTITFTSAAIGDSIVLEAYQGVWYTVSKTGTITIS